MFIGKIGECVFHLWSNTINKVEINIKKKGTLMILQQLIKI